MMLYSKGDAVDHLLGLDHRGKTIASFTLTPEAVAELLEPGAPPPSARIAAIGKLAAAGYPIRVRFSPIVPLRDWRAAYCDLIARLGAVATPEMATLWTLSMIDLDDLDGIVPRARLDADILAAAEDAREQMRGDKGAPFPPQIRARLYEEIAAALHEHSPETRVSLCLESPRVWRAAAPSLVQRCGGEFVCNCGPRATPAAVRRQRWLHSGKDAELAGGAVMTQKIS